MGKAMPESEMRLLRACLPAIARGTTNCTREARRLTRLGGPLEHRNFSATRNKLRAMRNARALAVAPHRARVEIEAEIEQGDPQVARQRGAA